MKNKSKMKRLFILCDGTWQELSSIYPTNIVKLAQAILPLDSKKNQQIVYYDKGVGTESGLNKIFGGHSAGDLIRIFLMHIYLYA